MGRKLDNTAKAFSLEEKKNNNTFRFTAILKGKVESKKLKIAIIKSLEKYPNYKVKIKSGFFWPYFERNNKEPIVDKIFNSSVKSIDLNQNNDYLFQVNYYDNKINLDVCHVLTDGVGAINLFKSILYNYFNLKYDIKSNDNIPKTINFNQDEYLKNFDRRKKYKKTSKKSYLIEEKNNISFNKTTSYILKLQELKNICKKNNVSISTYLTALYIYAIYKTIYNKSSKKDITITIPIDLRKHYGVETGSNFFTCMSVEGNVENKKIISFKQILEQVKNEFKDKLTGENIEKYLSRDVKLGTNSVIGVIPLIIKKSFMKCFGRLVSGSTTTTFSNVGPILVDDQYKKYIKNIKVSVNAGRIQKVKCTMCSYENNLTITINSNLINNKLEKEFYQLLTKYIGKVKLENSNI